MEKLVVVLRLLGPPPCVPGNEAGLTGARTEDAGKTADGNKADAGYALDPAGPAVNLYAAGKAFEVAPSTAD